ncbi:MAG: ABC transporter ATP-binding protein [Actinomycetia bacterium]|nr:ABC transporter ATP-binding protein [Actinomycetes bacterium]
MSIRLDSVSVRYEDDLAVNDLDLTIISGERFVLMGPSGSGKSTLLRAVAGLEPLETGTVEIDGKDVTTLPPHRRAVGLMFQEYALFPHLSVIDNVGYGLAMIGMGRDTARRKASALLDLAGLQGFESRKPDSLSGGERQRVALLRTLAPEPSLVMLDEPLGSLDLALREDLLAQMRTIVTELGATTLYVTHDRTEAFAFAERLAIMRHGRIVRTGTPEQVWDDPQTTFVARFIGHSNVLTGAAIGFDAPGITVPPGALALKDNGEIGVHIVESVFADGRYEIVVEVANGERLRIDSPVPLDSGLSSRITVDRSAVRELVVDEV